MRKPVAVVLMALFPVLAWSADKSSVDIALFQYLLHLPSGDIRVLQLAMTDAGKTHCESNLHDLATGFRQSKGADRATVEDQECTTSLPDVLRPIFDRKPVPEFYYVWYKPDAHDVLFTIYSGFDLTDPKAVCDYLMQTPPAPDAKCVAPPAEAAKP